MRYSGQRGLDRVCEPALDVHNDGAELEELVRRHRLGEEVGGIVVGLDEGNDKLVILHHISNIEVAALDVFDTLVELSGL